MGSVLHGGRTVEDAGFPFSSDTVGEGPRPGADARRYARTELKGKVNTDQARAALGLEPEDTKGKGDKAKTSKSEKDQ